MHKTIIRWIKKIMIFYTQLKYTFEKKCFHTNYIAGKHESGRPEPGYIYTHFSKMGFKMPKKIKISRVHLRKICAPPNVLRVNNFYFGSAKKTNFSISKQHSTTLFFCLFCTYQKKLSRLSISSVVHVRKDNPRTRIKPAF